MAVEAEARCVGELSAAQRHSWIAALRPSLDAADVNSNKIPLTYSGTWSAVEVL